ncbi:hypothetical protein GCM10012275_53420 [Longimycelium tulufanense]|uniref:Uncharacterized protein n=1 Tax=Longimycelium tulufanense TaxID=907463 RepID=A0A8J3CD51_9PSEU|nr:hypothetical protein [Longimycelium tulufanense]GGM76034.1 hypothetical protein GCM10012275_53420 [Longimycelium tulufanense]
MASRNVSQLAEHWTAKVVPPGTYYCDAPSVQVPPGVYVLGHDGDYRDGPTVQIRIDDAFDEHGNDVSGELAETLAELLRGRSQRRLAALLRGMARRCSRQRRELNVRPTQWAYEAACDALERRRVALVKALGLPSDTGFYEAVGHARNLRRDKENFRA